MEMTYHEPQTSLLPCSQVNPLSAKYQLKLVQLEQNCCIAHRIIIMQAPGCV